VSQQEKGLAHPFRVGANPFLRAVSLRRGAAQPLAPSAVDGPAVHGPAIDGPTVASVRGVSGRGIQGVKLDDRNVNATLGSRAAFRADVGKGTAITEQSAIPANIGHGGVRNGSIDCDCDIW
jgi:hypothetical protein